jgi:hypothetical protein
MGRRLALLLSLSVALFVGACNQELFDTECDVVVFNDTSCNVVVYVDGRRAFTVRPGIDRTLEDIGPGRHVLEALEGSGRVVERRTVELAIGEDFYWTLGHC